MDERYLLAAVLMVIGLQLGNGNEYPDKVTLFHCPGNTTSSWKYHHDTTFTGNVVEIGVEKILSTQGTGKMFCPSACYKTPECGLATLNETNHCIMYKYMDVSSTFEFPTTTTTIGVLSFERYVKDLYKIPKQSGSPYLHSEAFTVCQQLGKKLPRIENEDDLIDLKRFMIMYNLTDENYNVLIWLQGGKTSELPSAQWDDGTTIPSKVSTDGCGTSSLFTPVCKPIKKFEVADGALTIVSPSLLFDYGTRTAAPGSPDPHEVQSSKFVICK